MSAQTLPWVERLLDLEHRAVEALEELIRLLSAMRDGTTAASESSDGPIEVYYACLSRLRVELAEASPILLPDDPLTRRLIHRLQRGEPILLDEWLSGTPLQASISNESHDVLGLAALDFGNYDGLYGWPTMEMYAVGLLEAGHLVLRTEALPPVVDQIAKQIGPAYACGNYLAVEMLCRALLESATREIMVKEGFLDPEHPNHRITTEYFNKMVAARNVKATTPEDYLFEMADIRHLIRQSELHHFAREVGDLYTRLCSSVHARRTVDVTAARESIRKTYDLIHRLFEA